jgi:sec-independent protein translocase protein TatC
MDEVEQNKMPLLDHLVELRTRLMWAVASFVVCFVVCYYFSSEIFAFLVRPLASVWDGQNGRHMIFTGVTEAFFTYVKLSIWGGLCLAFPVISTQVWMFVAPGLYKNERHAFLPFILATPILFIMGAALAYYGIFPLVFKFFTSFETPGGNGTLPIELDPKVDQYLDLVTKLTFAFGLSFELPVLLTLLARVGLMSSSALRSKRRYAIVGLFIFAAIVTPPDVISMCSLAGPLILLYEVSILSVRMVERDRAKRRAEAGLDDE